MSDVNRWDGPAGQGDAMPKNALTPDDVASGVLTIVNQVCAIASSRLFFQWIQVLYFTGRLAYK